MSVAIEEFPFLFRRKVEGNPVCSGFTAGISVCDESAWILFDCPRQFVAGEYAAKLLACYAIMFQGTRYLIGVHPE
jgi:hypothetical protein